MRSRNSQPPTIRVGIPCGGSHTYPIINASWRIWAAIIPRTAQRSGDECSNYRSSARLQFFFCVQRELDHALEELISG